MVNAAASVRPALLEVAGLLKSFGGHQVVADVSFALQAGAIGGLIGPNGAGKTTLFNCLTGFMRADAGSVLLDGVSIGGRASSAVFAAGLARTFQIPRPFPEMTVLDNVMVAPLGQIGERLWTNWLQPRRSRRKNAKRAMRRAIGWTLWACRLCRGSQRGFCPAASANCSSWRG